MREDKESVNLAEVPPPKGGRLGGGQPQTSEQASPHPNPPPEGEGINTLRLKRLRYRSWHRGCKETDLVLGNFAETSLSMLDEASLSVYERLLDEQDGDIWNWLIDKETPPDAAYIPLITLLKSHGLPLN